MKCFKFFFSSSVFEAGERFTLRAHLVHFGLATFQVVSCHTWLVATVLDGVDLEFALGGRVW